ncbi:hypothetical protein F383_09053 [Gossypium arboreum]|uniref:Uncharacterized protein n=1 Tax=Gossypium arboreum TaxID=29729 RepID=A0A0B0NMU1_GOSAR|nr:hypothetical protein F383_09053 [Gossypium arboreum]
MSQNMIKFHPNELSQCNT